MQPLLSIVLPCYNPPDKWEEHIVENYRKIKNSIDQDPELIIVKDGQFDNFSRDSITFFQANIKRFRFIEYEINKGKGYALREGVKASAGDIIIYTDIDFPYNLESFLSVYNVLSNEKADVTVGVKNEDYYESVPFIRKSISKSLRFIIGVFFSMPITDTQCGLKGFRKKVTPLFLGTKINRYLFDLEFIRNCFREKLRVRAIPIQLREEVSFRKMNYKVLLSEIYSFFKLVIKS